MTAPPYRSPAGRHFLRWLRRRRADGIKYSGDLAKAIAAGADCVMVGSLLAGTDGRRARCSYQGRSYTAYRDMGSVAAMPRGSAERYFQQSIKNNLKLPEGIEGEVPYKARRRTCCTS
jgi:IMP dehydrogenase